jgi:predicted phage-related endonuclease
MGVPTASDFKTALAQGKDGGGSATSVTRKRYMRTLAVEIVTGEPRENYENGYMARGKLLEPEARELYALAYGQEPRRVGFVLNRSENVGYSPDSFIDDDGLLEIKTGTDAMIDVIERDVFPAEFKLQCQGGLYVTGRQWIDLCLYWPGMPLVVKRAYRDADCMAEIAGGLVKFNIELARLVQAIRRYGEPTPATPEPDASGSLLMAG